LASCADLSIDNLNEPDTERALSSPDDLKNLASGLYRSYYNNTYGYYSGEQSPAMMLNVVADANTCSWGNSGMRATSSEPRTAFHNTVSFPYEAYTNSFFNNMYSALSSASDVLGQMDAGVDFGSEAPMIEAWSKFNQALSLANIALTFDQGYIITEDTPEAELIDPILVPSTDIAAKAIELFDEAITLANANTFVLPDNYMNGITGGDQDLLAQLANSYAARLLAYMPRNASENSSVNWANVKTYASNGITSDFMLLMDDITWANDYQWNMAYPGWGRVDMRVINMMDSSYPAYNANGDDFAAPDSATVIDTPEIDDRLWTDFEHLASNNFRAERGLYHFSSFRNSRYDDYLSTWTTELPELYVAEIEMILAEAELMLGNVQAAADIINAGSRVTRGNLPAVAANAAAVRAAISHERMVELAVTSYGVQYFDMRKNDLLQEGTFTQLPIPAKLQELLQLPQPYYTFGGDNASSSTGGWRQ
jgi:hypothetical protein